MQITSEDINGFSVYLSGLERELKNIVKGKEAAEEEYSDAEFQGRQGLEDFRKKLQKDIRDDHTGMKSESAGEEERISNRHEEWSSRIEKIYRDLRYRIREDERLACEKKEDDLRQSKEKITGELEKKIEEGKEHPTPYTEKVKELQDRARKVQEKIELLAATHRLDLKPVQEPSAVDLLEKIHNLEYAVTDGEEVMDNAERAVKVIRRTYWPVRRMGMLFLFFIYILLHGGGIWFAMKNGVLRTCLPWISGSFLIVIILTLFGIWKAKNKMRTVVHWLRVNVTNAVEHLSRLEHSERERIAYDATLKERMDRMLEAEKRIEKQANDTAEKIQKAQESLEERYARIKKKAPLMLKRRLKRLKHDRAESKKLTKEKHRLQLKDKEAEAEDMIQQARKERDKKIKNLKKEWDRLLRECDCFAQAALETWRRDFPEWDADAWKQWTPPVEFPALIPLGSSSVNLKVLSGQFGESSVFPFPEGESVALPVSLGFPQAGSLFVRTDPGQRDLGLRIITNTLLRILTSFPPSRAKLTIIDPVGLGQSFSAFMKLGDYDESLVNSRIWTEAGHIEKKLTDLTEHMEKVIQKYLRNQYETVEEYNREAGVLTEAYRFLVITDFPTGFSDIAVERLASIVASGARCGVYTLILHDAKQKLPSLIDPGEIRRSGLVLRSGDDQCVIDRDIFNSAGFNGEKPPPPEQVTHILDRIGQEAQEAERVEVPFEAAAPEDGEMWSLKADENVKVPIGKAGADRMQYLSLGHGTQQHALIGGRTGSGKSTLFHVLITNASLWYSPREIEFYLIDFKKGVEFKRLASGSLPHARAIGIESDREFGLSVLRRVNEELGRRGEMFRAAGVQNLAGFRKIKGKENLQRILLIIDEFQEFFTEDDAVARDAALYLDRFVRQGRAFGIHVILGSQTLSGLYTLAKSTLGQIGVRVSLQCNEADSHLILGEDNTAARLLTRPGEAIYNDMSGLVEGNHPFQVVWLPEDVQKHHLSRILTKVKKEKWRPDSPTVVFEGNAPAELGGNEELLGMLKAKYDPKQSIERVWIGESSSIKGPASIEFVPNAGSNLLITGQHREAAFGVVSCAMVSLAARYQPEDLDMIVLISGERDEFRENFEHCAAILPHGIEIVMPRETGEVFDRLEARLNGNGDTDRKSLFLVAFGIHRMRALRQDDDLMFSMDKDAETPPGERFSNILSEGPETGIHTIVWCDGLGNLNRTFSRKTLREFDMKILFQMSASDSSELIDDVAANSLGLYGALLCVESDGIIEKFRPYSIPDKALLDRIKKALEKKYK